MQEAPYMSAAELCLRHKKGASLRILAELNACEPKAILSEMRKEKEPILTFEDKVALRRYRPIHIDRMTMYRSGYRVADIAKKQGVTTSAVYNWLGENLTEYERASLDKERNESKRST